jgi:hypothetical protein
LYELEEEALFITSLKGPHLVLSRNRLFQCLLGIVASPYISYFLLWFFILRPAGDPRQPIDVLDAIMVFALFPFLIILVLFLTPDRFDPLIPWRSKVLIGGKTLIRVLPAAT